MYLFNLSTKPAFLAFQNFWIWPWFGCAKLFFHNAHGWLRIFNPQCYEDSLYWLAPFFRFCLSPLPLLLFVVFLWLNMWSCQIQSLNLVNNFMDLNLLSLGSLVPAAPCCAFYTTMHQVDSRYDTDDMVFAKSQVWCNILRAHRDQYTDT